MTEPYGLINLVLISLFSWIVFNFHFCQSQEKQLKDALHHQTIKARQQYQSNFACRNASIPWRASTVFVLWLTSLASLRRLRWEIMLALINLVLLTVSKDWVWIGVSCHRHKQILLDKSESKEKSYMGVMTDKDIWIIPISVVFLSIPSGRSNLGTPWWLWH